LLSWIFFTICFQIVNRSYGNNYPTRCNRIQFIWICQLLNTFRVVFHPSSGAHNTVSTVSETFWLRSRQVAVQVPLMPDIVDTVLWAPDWWVKYHLKHVEQLTDLNKLYSAASCWIIIAILCDARSIEHLSIDQYHRTQTYYMYCHSIEYQCDATHIMTVLQIIPL